MKANVRFRVLPQWIRKALRNSETEQVSPGFEVTSVDVSSPEGASLSLQRVDIACMDCGDEHYTPFMATDDAWEEAGLDTGRICVECFQERLGRPLQLSDFAEGAGLNKLLFLGAKLA